MNKEYLFNTIPDLGREQLDYLEILVDPQTTAFLDAVGVKPGQRCLDLGAGGGSITRWLAERTGPTGTVVAVDIDTDHLVEQPGIEVRRHDINDGIPPGGPFDLIHTRMVLLHLPRREEILHSLVDALAPGGWLVIGEYIGPQHHVLSAPSAADEELFHRVQHMAHNVVGRGGGVSSEWGREVDGHMVRAGLTNVDSLEYTHTAAGGTAGCLLSRNYIMQLETPLLGAGVTEDELRRYRELLLDPRFRAWFYPFVCTRGQKPASVDGAAARDPLREVGV